MLGDAECIAELLGVPQARVPRAPEVCSLSLSRRGASVPPGGDRLWPRSGGEGCPVLPHRDAPTARHRALLRADGVGRSCAAVGNVVGLTADRAARRPRATPLRHGRVGPPTGFVRGSGGWHQRRGARPHSSADVAVRAPNPGRPLADTPGRDAGATRSRARSAAHHAPRSFAALPRTRPHLASGQPRKPGDSHPFREVQK
mgnify:CR=1 FL=1